MCQILNSINQRLVENKIKKKFKIPFEQEEKKLDKF